MSQGYPLSQSNAHEIHRSMTRCSVWIVHIADPTGTPQGQERRLPNVGAVPEAAAKQGAERRDERVMRQPRRSHVRQQRFR